MVGDNGTGKTNLLDAVHYLSMCKSAFGLSDTQCVRHGSEAFLVDGRYGEPATDRTERIVCSFKKGGQKKLCRNGKEYEKLSDHIGLIPLVLVTPSDTALINESGEERRKYLNSFISQLDREYLSALVRYNRAAGRAQQAAQTAAVARIRGADRGLRRTTLPARRDALAKAEGARLGTRPRRGRVLRGAVGATASGSASATARSSTTSDGPDPARDGPAGSDQPVHFRGRYTATTC